MSSTTEDTELKTPILEDIGDYSVRSLNPAFPSEE